MWSNDLLSIIYTRVKVIASNKLKSKYPNINFTTTTQTQSPAKFPTVAMQKISGSEVGRDLEGREVYGVTFTVQIETISNTSQRDADVVSDVVMDIMKQMSFEIVGDPYQDNSEPGVYRNVTRYRRNIDKNDVI